MIVDHAECICKSEKVSVSNVDIISTVVTTRGK